MMKAVIMSSSFKFGSLLASANEENITRRTNNTQSRCAFIPFALSKEVTEEQLYEFSTFGDEFG